MAKSVQVQIDTADLELLKANQYNLCFAKMVNGDYTVVWQSYSDYLSSNPFSWTAAYQMFGSDTFPDPGTTITISTNPVDIALGEQATLDAAGYMNQAVTGGPSDGITMINQYGPINPGLNGVSTGPDGVQRTTPIFVAPLEIAKSTAVLMPVEKVQIWFKQNLVAGTAIVEGIFTSNAVEVDLTKVDAATVKYEQGSWSNTFRSELRTAETTPKEVQIQIAQADYELLKAGNYLLCVARKVNNTYDVVWNAFGVEGSQFLISWVPEYQLFATNSFVAGAVVAVETNVVQINLGQQATLDAAGVLGTPVAGGPSDSVTLVNNLGPIHPGLSTQGHPIYVEPGAIEPGYETLTPVDVVRIWFQQDIAPGTMLDPTALVAVSNAIEVDLTDQDKTTLLYQNGKWSITGP